MATLPVGYRFEKSATGYALLARHGEIVSAFYSPEDLDAGVIAAFHALGVAHGRLALKRELQAPLARLLREVRAIAANNEYPELHAAIERMLDGFDAI